MKVNSILLSAVNNLLISNQGDVNITPIVEDLVVDPNDRDAVTVTKAAVALTMKGIRPDLPTELRYEKTWRGFREYRVIGSSLILGVYKVKVVSYRWIKTDDDDQDQSYEKTNEEQVQLIGPDDWTCYAEKLPTNDSK